MALFFKKKKKENKKEFKSKIILTENVNEELIKVAKEYDIPLSSLDFNLLSYKTYIKFAHEDFVKADKETLEKFKLIDNLINKEVEIKQVYEIEIKKYEAENDFELMGEMKINNLYTYAEFIVSKKSIIRVNNIFEKVSKELNKKKIRNSLLIGIFDLMEEDVKKLQSVILIDEKLNNDFTIKLCEGINPINSIKGQTILHFKTKEKNLISPVKKNDVLIEIIFPKQGRNGRNCKGKIIKVKEYKDFTPPEILFDEKTIDKKVDDGKILYIAKKSGYITKEDDKYIIKDEMEVKQINLKTGNVKNGDKSDVKINVKESDVLKEAIMDNMVVESAELYVKGNVGNKAKIKAKKLKINGQTHKNSKIIVENGEINVHKGEVKAKKIKINRLEGGKVRADEVEIDIGLGGIVYAKKIKINKMLSHNTLFASEKIIICEDIGEENILAISPKRILKEIDIDKLKSYLKEIEQYMNIKNKEYKKLKEIFLSIKDVMNEYKKEYLNNKKQRKRTSSLIIKKLKEFKELTDKMEKLKREINTLKKEKENIYDNIDYLQSGVFNAKILCNSVWKPFNRIMFELIEPPIKIVYDTKEKEDKCGFKLKDEDNLKIVKIKVDNDLCD